jgi:hypothetical protein
MSWTCVGGGRGDTDGLLGSASARGVAKAHYAAVSPRSPTHSDSRFNFCGVVVCELEDPITIALKYKWVLYWLDAGTMIRLPTIPGFGHR